MIKRRHGVYEVNSQTIRFMDDMSTLATMGIVEADLVEILNDRIAKDGLEVQIVEKKKEKCACKKAAPKKAPAKKAAKKTEKKAPAKKKAAKKKGK